MDIKEKTKRYLFEHYHISYDTTEALFALGLIQEHRAKRVFIKEEYPDLREDKGHLMAKMELCERYFVSSRTIDRYIYANE